MRHDPASAAIVVMLRSLKMYGLAQAASDPIKQGAPAFTRAGSFITTKSVTVRWRTNCSAEIRTIVSTASRNCFLALNRRQQTSVWVLSMSCQGRRSC